MEKSKIINIKNLSDIPAVETGHVDLKRNGVVLRVGIKGISFKAQQEIEDKYQLPRPPVQYKRVPGMDKPQPVSNTEDAEYLKEIKRLSRDSFRETVLAGLDIEIDGNTIDEKWLALQNTGLVAGDIEFLAAGILQLSNLTDRDIRDAKDFFG